MLGARVWCSGAFVLDAVGMWHGYWKGNKVYFVIYVYSNYYSYIVTFVNISKIAQKQAF